MVFLEEGVFYCWCFATAEADGRWSASVTFERRDDHRAGKTLIPAIRHLVDGRFDTENAATQAAIAYADNMANHAAEDVGLD